MLLVCHEFLRLSSSGSPPYVAGHAEWWRRQVEDAIANADGAADLENRLHHLHQLLRQPYDEINEFSTLVFFCLLFFTTLSVVGVTFATTAPAYDGSFLAMLAYVLWGFGGNFLGYFFTFLFLFWPVQTRCALAAPAHRSDPAPATAPPRWLWYASGWARSATASRRRSRAFRRPRSDCRGTTAPFLRGLM